GRGAPRAIVGVAPGEHLHPHTVVVVQARDGPAGRPILKGGVGANPHKGNRHEPLLPAGCDHRDLGIGSPLQRVAAGRWVGLVCTGAVDSGHPVGVLLPLLVLRKWRTWARFWLFSTAARLICTSTNSSTW